MRKLGLLMSALLLWPSEASADVITGPAGVPFDQYRGIIFLNGTVNDAPAAMMLDSGAAMTCVDQAFAAQTGLKGRGHIKARGEQGSTDGEVARNVTVRVGDLNLQGLNVAIIDLGPVARALGRSIPVILGREAFKSRVVSLDFPHHRIIFKDPATFRPSAGATRVSLTESGKLPVITIQIGNRSLPAEVDLGDDGTIMLANRVWKSSPEFTSLPYTAGGHRHNRGTAFQSRPCKAQRRPKGGPENRCACWGSDVRAVRCEVRPTRRCVLSRGAVQRINDRIRIKCE
jgi:hypothetical protein